MARICDEAEGLMQEGRWSDLVSLLLTSFDLVFANAPEKGALLYMCVSIYLYTERETVAMPFSFNIIFSY